MIPEVEYRLPSSEVVRQARFDGVQFKASHNSFAKGVQVATQLRRHPEEAHRFGCRGLELDLHEGQGGFAWSVKHLRSDPDEDFADFLRLLRSWSLDRPGHDVITVTLDLKQAQGEPPGFPDRLDGFLRQSFDQELLVRPDDVLDGDEVVWPTLGQMAGRFVFCLSGLERFKAEYARHGDRLCFADRNVTYGTILKRRDPASDRRIFLNFDGGRWVRLKRRLDGPVASRPLRTNRGYILRVYGLNSPQAWQFAERRGFNVLSTDSLTKDWSRFGSAPPFRRI